jgi:hypothetical protein
MCPKIRCDGESEKFCKIFDELNGAYIEIETFRKDLLVKNNCIFV